MQLSIRSIDAAGPPETRGEGHRARLVIPPVHIPEHSPFLLMAEDWFAPPAGFPTHPHRGIETVTFVLGGELMHADHTGGAGRLGAGDIQFMTTGGGVMHSEMPGPKGIHTLQLWLNLPARLKRVKARYQNVLAADAPALREKGVEARLYAGKLGDLAAPFATTFSGRRFPRASARSPLFLPATPRLAPTGGRPRPAMSHGPRSCPATATGSTCWPSRRAPIPLAFSCSQARSSTSRWRWAGLSS